MGTQIHAPKGAQPQFSANVRCGQLNVWMDSDATWYGGRPRPKRFCVRWEPSPPKRGGGAQPLIFGPCLLWPNGYGIEIPLGREVGLGSGDTVLDGDPALPQKRGKAIPNFRPMSVVAKNGWMHKEF